MKGLLTGIALTLLAELAIGYLALGSGRIPANADAAPGKLEIWMATKSLDATLGAQAPTTTNPIPLSAENLSEGVRLYAENCAVCHGTAAGDPAATPIAKGLYLKPPQFGSEGVEDDSEGLTYWKVKHGIRMTAMPSFSGTLSDRQIWTLALFLKHMDKLPPAVQGRWQQVKNWPVVAPANAR